MKIMMQLAIIFLLCLIGEAIAAILPLSFSGQRHQHDFSILLFIMGTAPGIPYPQTDRFFAG